MLLKLADCILHGYIPYSNFTSLSRLSTAKTGNDRLTFIPHRRCVKLSQATNDPSRAASHAIAAGRKAV